ncbi:MULTISPECIES: efflux RND transporter permease subunit [unclassified Anaeromyxobacter]|uniref:efflux RND transporter permease subunit n=1 Tax=unclassified Anaeromyxobacter TaxID=2620896 RepID=UPI001F56EFA7|nr:MULTISPECIES: efflux RND transporter permease subunit [unclassified Anaeromyxobacter]
MSPIRTFIRRPIFTSMLLLAVVVFGLFSYPRIGVDQMPEVDFPIVTVTTILPGADPETVEENVSKPLEEALNTISGLDTLRSQNFESVSMVVLRFELSKPVDVAAQDVRDKVQATLSKLPKEIETPVVQKLDLGAMPIVQLALSGPVPIEELTRIAEDELKPGLQRLQGVGSIDVVGGREREVNVVVDPVRLRSYGLAATDVSQAIRAQSISVPGGRTLEPGQERVVKLETEARSVEEIRDLVVASPGNRPIRVRDVANVVDGPGEARSAATLDGRSAVALVIRKQSGANTVEVAERVKGDLAALTQRLPAGSKLEIVTDNSKFIRGSISAVQHDLVIGAILAVLVVLVFLRDWRATIVSALALPTSVIGTFAVMHALGFTFNTVTMLALTLSIGLLIDDAIVVIENIVRHLEKGERPREAALNGTGQIALAVLAVTLSVIAVFIPVAFMKGMVGRFFFQFGVTVAVAVAISYFVSMTLTPMMSARILAKHGHGTSRVGAVLERFFTAIERGYRRTLEWALAHRAVTVAAAVGVLFVTVGLGKFLQFTFIPSQDQGGVTVSVELPVGTPLAETQREAERIAGQIRGVPGVVNVFSLVGGGVDEAVNKADLTVNLLRVNERRYSQEEFKQHLRQSLAVPPGTVLSVADQQMMAGGGSRPQPVQFNIRSDDWDAILAAVEKTKAAMLKNPGLTDVDTTYRAGRPLLSVQVDRDRAAAVGLPAAAVGQTLRAFLGQDAFGTYREKGNQYDVKLRLPDETRADPDAIGALTLRTPKNELVELRSVARLQGGEGPSQIERQALKRQVTMLANLKGYSLGEAISFLNGIAKEFPPQVQTDFEGQGKELANTGREFLMALLLGIILIYMILAAQFESLLDPVTIMLSLPLAVIGAIAALLLAHEFMSMLAMIGMIMLAGLVTKNGILIVEFTNQLRAEGRTTLEALLEAGPLRLRPILMTSIAMIAGMIPVAFARGDGAEMRTGMAWAIIGGLAASTVLTLVVVPVVYALLDGLRGRLVRALPAAPHEEEETGDKAA